VASKRGAAAREVWAEAVLTTLVKSRTGAFELSNVGVPAKGVGGEVGCVDGSAETVAVCVVVVVGVIKCCSGIVSAIRMTLCLRIVACPLCERRCQPKRAGAEKRALSYSNRGNRRSHTCSPVRSNPYSADPGAVNSQGTARKPLQGRRRR